MLRSLIIILFCLTVNALSAQRVTGVHFSQEGQQIIINYDLSGVRYYQTINIAVFASTDGGKTFQGPLQKVDGDVGLNIRQGRDHQIIWDVLEEMPDFGGEVSFEVRAVINEEKPKSRIYAGYKGSYLAPIGIIAGTTGKVGFYLSGRADLFYLRHLNANLNETKGTIGREFPGPGYYSFTSKHHTQRLSMTDGLSFRLSGNLRLYLGGGYTINDALWEIARYDYNDEFQEKEWAKNVSRSYSSLEAEGGLWMRMRSFFMAVGANACPDKWVDVSLSTGIVFK